VPDAQIGFEHAVVTNTFTRESIDSTFIHDIISSTWMEVIEVSDRKPALETIYKQPDESFPVYGDFVNVLVTGETIVIGTSSVAVEDIDGTDATATMCQGLSVTDTTKLKTTLKKAGTEAASPYKITFIAKTSLGNEYEIDGKIRVVEL
jgi:hypothetical protein